VDAPYVIVVSGLPAAGKSTLSERLGKDLEIPVVCRDALRPRGFDEDVSRDERVGRAHETTRLVLESLAASLDERGAAVLDGNFNRPDHSDGLHELLQSRGARVFEVCLWADPDILTERFAARAEPPLTDALKPYFFEVLHRPRRAVIPDAEYVVEFDTTHFHALDDEYPSVLAEIRRRIPTGP
jgi:predicted kinase